MGIEPFNIIIAGSRGFNDSARLHSECDKVLEKVISENRPVVVISGAAKGADKLGEQYAKERGFELRIFPADWDSHGKLAGRIRNEEMAQEADGAIVFWDGSSPGSAHMIRVMKLLGKKLRVIEYKREQE